MTRLLRSYDTLMLVVTIVTPYTLIVQNRQVSTVL
jgi:hypothetical protein